MVLQEYEAERGHQYASVTPEVHRVPPSSLEIVFKIDEGPKVKVGNIDIVGNNVFSDRVVIRAMHNLRPIGIPQSIFLENLFARTFDSSKLEEDKSRVQDFYQEHGYFVARATDSSVKVYDVGGPGKGTHIWLIHPNKPGKRADISVTIEEGLKYKLHAISFTGVKFFRTPEALMRPLFGMSEGDVFSTAKLRKGIENMRKLYGEFGFIDFVGEPGFEPDTKAGTIDMSLSVDEGKQFFVRRIDFQRQHHHSRQGHPPRAADRRRRHVQHAPLGRQHPAPEPARLFRAVKGRRRRPTSSATPRRIRSILRSS